MRDILYFIDETTIEAVFDLFPTVLFCQGRFQIALRVGIFLKYKRLYTCSKIELKTAIMYGTIQRFGG